MLVSWFWATTLPGPCGGVFAVDELRILAVALAGAVSNICSCECAFRTEELRRLAFVRAAASPLARVSVRALLADRPAKSPALLEDSGTSPWGAAFWFAGSGTAAMELAGLDSPPFDVSLVSGPVLPSRASTRLMIPGSAVNQPARNATRMTTTAMVVQVRHRRRNPSVPSPASRLVW